MWFELDETLVNEAFSLKEAQGVASLRHASVQDPVPGILSGLAARIRAAVLAGGRTRLRGGALCVPLALRAEATAILRYKLLVRFALTVTDERKSEAAAAEQRLDEIAKGLYPLLDESSTDQSTPPPTYHGRPHRWHSPANGGIM